MLGRIVQITYGKARRMSLPQVSGGLSNETFDQRLGQREPFLVGFGVGRWVLGRGVWFEYVRVCLSDGFYCFGGVWAYMFDP